MEYNRRYLPADGFKGTELASVGGAIAATSSCCSNPLQVCLAAAHGLASCSHATNVACVVAGRSKGQKWWAGGRPQRAVPTGCAGARS